jgi:hypothetical protein
MQVLSFVSHNDSLFEKFVSFPEQIYEKKSPRFLTKDSCIHIFIHAYFLVKDGDKITARAALYTNPDLKYNNCSTMCFGLYECVNDFETSSLLLTKLKKEAKAYGAEYLIGPMNGSTWDTYRFSIDNSNPQFFMEPFYHVYYNEQLSTNGFYEIANYVSQLDTELNFDNPNFLRWEKIIAENKVTPRNIDIEEYEKELDALYPFICETFKNNFLYTEISKQAFLEKYLPLKQILDKNFVWIAEDKDKKIVAVFFAIPDFNSTQKGAIIKTLARLPDRKYAGVLHVIANHFIKHLSLNGYTYIIHAFMHVNNTSKNLSSHFSGVNYKNYNLYGISL